MRDTGRFLSTGTRHLLPRCERASSQQSIVDGPKQMSADAKEIVNGQESLRLARRFEPPHLPLLLAGMLMRHLGTIVRITFVTMHRSRHDRFSRGTGARELITHHHSGRASVLAQLLEETHRCPLVLALLHKNIEDIPILVHGTPQY